MYSRASITKSGVYLNVYSLKNGISNKVSTTKLSNTDYTSKRDEILPLLNGSKFCKGGKCVRCVFYSTKPSLDRDIFKLSICKVRLVMFDKGIILNKKYKPIHTTKKPIRKSVKKITIRKKVKSARKPSKKSVKKTIKKRNKSTPLRNLKKVSSTKKL